MEFQRNINQLLDRHSAQDPQLLKELLSFVERRSNSIQADISGLPDDALDHFDELLDVILKEADKKPERGDELDKFLRRVCHRANRLPPHLMLHDVKFEPGAVAGGGSCDIHTGTHDEKAIAMKVPRLHTYPIEQDRKKLRKQFRLEALHWRLLRHPNIYPFLGLSEEAYPDGRPCLVSPWCNYGEVTGFLNKHPDHDRIRLIQDVAEGLSYLHGRGFVHGDLKAANILINDEKKACIADFGIGKFLQTFTLTARTTSPKGTMRWMPPEQLKPSNNVSDDRRPESDVYSFALVCVEIYTGQIPWPDLIDPPIIQKVFDGERPDRPATMPEEIWEIVQSCWTHEREERLSAAQIVSSLSDYRALQFTLHPFIDLKGVKTRLDLSQLSREGRLTATHVILTGLTDVLAILGDIVADEGCARVVHEQQAEIVAKVQYLTGSTTGIATSPPDSDWVNGSSDRDPILLASSPIFPATPPSPSQATQRQYLQLFNQMAIQRRIPVEWRPVASGPAHAQTWSVACIVDGIEQGSGFGNKQQQAKEEAAREAYFALGWDQSGPVNHPRSPSLQSPVFDFGRVATSPLPSTSHQLPPAPYHQMPASPPRSQTMPVAGRPYLPLFNELANRYHHQVEYPAESTGPAHALNWTARVLVNGEEKGSGAGPTKQSAKEEAARQAYIRMGWSANGR